MELGIFGCFHSDEIEIEDFRFKYNMQYAYLISLIVFFIYWFLKIVRK
jgi:hypothetical protein